MATTNLGAVGISAGGVYDSETVYKKYKVVSANGGSYMYINTTPAAGVPLTDTSHWQQIASVGGQDLVDAAVAARDAAQGYKDAAAASAAQLAAGIGSPAKSYANLAALNAANPAHDRTYLTEDDWKIALWDEIAQEFVAGGAYQAASVVGDIAYLTSQLAESINVSTNLIDLDRLEINKIVGQDGTLVDHASRSTTVFIPAKENVDFSMVGANYIGYYDKDKNFISRRGFDYTSQKNTAKTPLGTSYVRISVANNRFDIAQANEGDSLLPYEEYYKRLSSDIEVEGIPNVDIEYEGNLFEGNVLSGFMISPAMDYLYFGGTDTIRSRIAVIEIKDIDKVSLEVKGEHDRFSVALSNGLTTDFLLNKLHIDMNPTSDSKLIVDNQTNHKYLLVMYSNTGQPTPDIKVYKGDTFSYTIKINNHKLLTEDDVLEVSDNSERFATTFVSENIPPALPTSHEEVYGWYDDLMANSDGYVTKELKGNDGQDNPMYVYKFGREEVINDFGFTKPVIALTTGVHGNEKSMIVGLFQFMKKLTLNESKNELLTRIKANINFEIMPVTNPTGLAQDTRNNWNDVNINRNFDYMWEQSTDLDKGTEPASELETQIIQDWIDNGNFEQVTDCHRADMSAGADTATWFVANYDGEFKIPMRKEYYNVLTKLSTVWSEKFEEFPKNINFGNIRNYANLPQLWQYAMKDGKRAALLEMSQTWRYFPTDQTKVQHRNTWASDVIGNYILEISKRYI